jgi:hypothetical protein
MRLPKAVREQQAAQYLITTLCVWDVEQRWDLDFALLAAWDKGRFDDPYRQVLLPKYPATRQGVCAALAVQWGTPRETLAAHIAHGHIFADYAKPWDVAIASLGKLTTLVRWEYGYSTRIWRVADGTLDLHQAYREQETDKAKRSTEQLQAKGRLWALSAHLHPDDVAEWVTQHVGFAIPGRPPLALDCLVPLRRYHLLRDLWHQIGLFQGQAEQDAFLRFLEAEAPRRAASTETWDLLRRARQSSATAVPDCFRALGLAWPCTEDDVKHAYRTLAYAAHPDAGGTAEAFHLLTDAYEEALKYLEHHHRKEAF